MTQKYINYDVIILLEFKNNRIKTNLNYWRKLNLLQQVSILNLVPIETNSNWPQIWYGVSLGP
jgi:hypothetical protein